MVRLGDRALSWGWGEKKMSEAYAYAIRHHVEVLADMGHRPRRFLVSDGGSASDVWMQIVADVLDAPQDEARIAEVRSKVQALTQDFPVYR